MQIDLSLIPEDWYLSFLRDQREAHRYSKQIVKHLTWRVALQHVQGGRETVAEGPTPAEALSRAIYLVSYPIKEVY